MVNLIKNFLLKIYNDLDSGNSNISESEQLEMLELLQRIVLLELSKTEAAKFLGISRSTFDNYVKKGLLPEGKKRQGFKELSWNKADLIKYGNRNT